MNNSKIEKLKMITQNGDLNEGKIDFIRRVLGDESCPIIFESNLENIKGYLEKETLENKCNAIIKDITLISGTIKYGIPKFLQYDDFVQTRELPILISHNGVVYIEEYKTINTHKEILDRKILVFSYGKSEESVDNSLIDKPHYILLHSINIRLRDKKAFLRKYVIL